MWNKIKDVSRQIVRAVWCHRMIYAGLAGAYGALCFDLLDKTVVEQLVCGLYVALVVQR